MLWSLINFRGPLLVTYVCVCLVLGRPALDTALQMCLTRAERSRRITSLVLLAMLFFFCRWPHMFSQLQPLSLYQRQADLPYQTQFIYLIPFWTLLPWRFHCCVFYGLLIQRTKSKSPSQHQISLSSFLNQAWHISHVTQDSCISPMLCALSQAICGAYLSTLAPLFLVLGQTLPSAIRLQSHLALSPLEQEKSSGGPQPLDRNTSA